MREILFRGKRTDNGKWIEGSYVKMPTEEICIMTDKIETKFVFGILPETVGQFTGLIDRNGTKIFEGDVVHLIGGEFYQGYHEIDENIVVKDITDCVYFGEVELLEVIGNIHDNPELMEELVKKETEKAINYWNEKRGNNEID